MTVAAILLVTGTMLSWIAVRRCPLARAIGRQIDQVADASR
jgi:hypothetical protein